VAKLIGKPAPTDFIQYFTINFIPHFTIDVGAGSPRYLPPTDKLCKPAPTPPRNQELIEFNMVVRVYSLGGGGFIKVIGG